jgi:hypothetical protein
MALAASAWAAPNSGEDKLSKAEPGATDWPKSARMLTTRPAKGA